MSTQMPNENNEKEPSLDVIRLMLDIKTNVTGADVEALADAAVREGDHETAAVCRDALDGDQAGPGMPAASTSLKPALRSRMGAPRREPPRHFKGFAETDNRHPHQQLIFPKANKTPAAASTAPGNGRT